MVKEVPENIEFLENVEEGLNEVHRVSYGGRDAILKVHSEKEDEDFYHNYEAIALGLIKSKTEVPVPEVYHYSDLDCTSYLIMEEIEGINGREIILNTDLEQKKDIMESLGSFLKQVHEEARFDDFGYLRRKNDNIEVWKSFSSWKKIQKKHTRNDLKTLKGTRFEKFRDPALNFFENHKDLLDRNFKPVLIHDDNRFENLLYREGEVRSVLDWATGYNGAASYDIVKAEYLMIDHGLKLSEEGKKELREALYRGYCENYGKRDLRKIHMLSTLTWAMRGYQNWSRTLDEDEREFLASNLAEKMSSLIH